jgi:hypothetical protein
VTVTDVVVVNDQNCRRFSTNSFGTRALKAWIHVDIWFVPMSLHSRSSEINGRRLLSTTLLNKVEERRHVLLKGEDISYLGEETWRRRVLVAFVKWQTVQIDRLADRQIDR